MSHFWDIACRDCDERLHFRWNHGEEKLTRILHTLPALATIEGDISVLSEDDGFRTTWWLCDYGPTLIELVAFAKKHRNCNVMLRDEYGAWQTDCNKWVKCPSCYHNVSCNRPTGHRGECGWVENRE